MIEQGLKSEKFMIRIEGNNKIGSAGAVNRIERIHRTPEVQTERPKDQDSYRPKPRSKELDEAYKQLQLLLAQKHKNQSLINIVRQRIMELEEGNQPDKK
jgi:hypothetical protein